MITNIKYKNDLITLDYEVKQIRYLKDLYKRGNIEFINLSNDDIEGYKFLFKENKTIFFKTLKEDIKNNLDIDIDIKFCKVVK